MRAEEKQVKETELASTVSYKISESQRNKSSES